MALATGAPKDASISSISRAFATSDPKETSIAPGRPGGHKDAGSMGHHEHHEPQKTRASAASAKTAPCTGGPVTPASAASAGRALATAGPKHTSTGTALTTGGHNNMGLRRRAPATGGKRHEHQGHHEPLMLAGISSIGKKAPCTDGRATRASATSAPLPQVTTKTRAALASARSTAAGTRGEHQEEQQRSLATDGPAT